MSDCAQYNGVRHAPGDYTLMLILSKSSIECLVDSLLRVYRHRCSLLPMQEYRPKHRLAFLDMLVMNPYGKPGQFRHPEI